jgi:hypothetical protein
MESETNRLTELSPLILAEIQKVSRDAKEQQFLIALLQHELAYYAYEDPNDDHYKRDYKFLLDSYFPFSEAKEE